MLKTTKKILVYLLLVIVLFQAVALGDEYKVTLYALDGRTIEVAESSVDSWLSEGWYMEPVCTVYAADGRSMIIGKSSLAKWEAVGWTDGNKPITIYSPNGKTAIISYKDLSSYKSVGWYDYPVACVYAPDGRMALIARSSLAQWEAVGWTDGNKPITIYSPNGKTATIAYKDLSSYKSVGWYDYPVTYVYTFDGRKAIVAKSQVSSYLAVGWLDKPAHSIYDDTIRNLYNYYNTMDFSPYPSYTTYDINKDGIPELIYDDGMYEAARQFHVYTYQNGKVVFVGSHGACHGYVASYPNGNGILLMGGHMGYEHTYRLQIKNNKLTSTLIQEKDTNKTGEDYSEPWEIVRGAYQLEMTTYGW